MTRSVHLWVTGVMGRRFERIDADDDWSCRDLTVAVRGRLSASDNLLLYHYGLDRIVPPQGADSARDFGIRPGDLLFAVSEHWPLVICRWLADEAMDALLGCPTPGRSSPL
jgi:hypothetical protein